MGHCACCDHDEKLMFSMLALLIHPSATEPAEGSAVNAGGGQGHLGRVAWEMSYFARLHGKNYSISVILFQIQLMRQVKFIIILLHTNHDCSAFIKLEDKLPENKCKGSMHTTARKKRAQATMHRRTEHGRRSVAHTQKRLTTVLSQLSE